MSPSEMMLRVRDRARAHFWRRRYFERGAAPLPRFLPSPPPFGARLPSDLVHMVAPAARARIVEAADRLLNGRWTIFAIERDDVGSDVDWQRDVKHEVSAPADTCSFAQHV